MALTRADEDSLRQPLQVRVFDLQTRRAAEINTRRIDRLAAYQGGDISSRATANRAVVDMHMRAIGKADDVARVQFGAGLTEDELKVRAACEHLAGQCSRRSVTAHLAARDGDDAAAAVSCKALHSARLDRGSDLHHEITDAGKSGWGEASG
jgi:hypothetical protein